MADAIVRYQDPMEADKILKIQKELDDTKVVLHKTIDSVLARGEKLDNLVDSPPTLASPRRCLQASEEAKPVLRHHVREREREREYVSVTTEEG